MEARSEKLWDVLVHPMSGQSTCVPLNSHFLFKVILTYSKVTKTLFFSLNPILMAGKNTPIITDGIQGTNEGVSDCLGLPRDMDQELIYGSMILGNAFQARQSKVYTYSHK